MLGHLASNADLIGEYDFALHVGRRMQTTGYVRCNLADRFVYTLILLHLAGSVHDMKMLEWCSSIFRIIRNRTAWSRPAQHAVVSALEHTNTENLDVPA